MTKSELGLVLAAARRRSGKTQAELARAMGTTQPVVARAEAGYRMPTLAFIDRWARATGAPISLSLGENEQRPLPASARRAIVRSALGPGRFNPWDRNPSPVEADLLKRAGRTRRHFERLKKRGKGPSRSCEDLYIERLRHATVSWPREDISFDAALEVALTNYVTMDWDYVRGRLRRSASSEGKVALLMADVNRRIRSRARRTTLELRADVSS